MISAVSGKNFIIICWILFTLWLLPFGWMKNPSLPFFYWDCGLVLVLTTAFSTSLIYLIKRLAIQNYWLIAIPVIYAIFDYAENLISIAYCLNRPSCEIPEFVYLITLGKWIFFALSTILVSGMFLYLFLRNKQN